MLNDSLYDALVGDATIYTKTDGRVFDTVAPQALERTLPYIVFVQISNTIDETLEKTTDLAITRMQIDCYAESPKQARLLAKNVINLLVDLEGEFEGTTLRRPITLELDFSMFTGIEGLFHHVLEFEIWHKYIYE